MGIRCSTVIPPSPLGKVSKEAKSPEIVDFRAFRFFVLKTNTVVGVPANNKHMGRMQPQRLKTNTSR